MSSSARQRSRNSLLHCLRYGPNAGAVARFATGSSPPGDTQRAANGRRPRRGAPRGALPGRRWRARPAAGRSAGRPRPCRGGRCYRVGDVGGRGAAGAGGVASALRHRGPTGRRLPAGPRAGSDGALPAARRPAFGAAGRARSGSGAARFRDQRYGLAADRPARRRTDRPLRRRRGAAPPSPPCPARRELPRRRHPHPAGGALRRPVGLSPDAGDRDAPEARPLVARNDQRRSTTARVGGHRRRGASGVDRAPRERLRRPRRDTPGLARGRTGDSSHRTLAGGSTVASRRRPPRAAPRGGVAGAG